MYVKYSNKKTLFPVDHQIVTKGYFLTNLNKEALIRVKTTHIS